MTQFSKFFILGLFSTLIDFFIYSFLIYLKLDYIIAILFGYGSGFIFNFFIGRKHVFKNGRKVNNFFAEFKFVFAINIIAVILNILIVYILYSYLDLMNQIYARAFAIVLVFLWNYTARKIFVYH